MWNGMNKRAFPRAEYPCKVRVESKDLPQLFETQTQNIGAGGICVILNKELEQLSLVKLEVYLKDRDHPIQCRGKIVWVIKNSKPHQQESFDTGIEFVDLKDEDKKIIEDLVNELLDKTDF